MSEVSEQASERTDERVAQYFSLYSWLFWPTGAHRQNDWVGFPVDFLGDVLDVRSLVELGHVVIDVLHFYVDNRFGRFTLARILSLKEQNEARGTENESYV